MELYVIEYDHNGKREFKYYKLTELNNMVDDLKLLNNDKSITNIKKYYGELKQISKFKFE